MPASLNGLALIGLWSWPYWLSEPSTGLKGMSSRGYGDRSEACFLSFQCSWSNAGVRMKRLWGLLWCTMVQWRHIEAYWRGPLQHLNRQHTGQKQHCQQNRCMGPVDVSWPVPNGMRAVLGPEVGQLHVERRDAWQDLVRMTPRSRGMILAPSVCSWNSQLGR